MWMMFVALLQKNCSIRGCVIGKVLYFINVNAIYTYMTVIKHVRNKSSCSSEVMSDSAGLPLH
jgi:hypothetical protein